ncbi:hypothetical protein, partial [Ornithinicoccus halotolerans]|uniref:hypothetical protein n=1 Tax=Ornithinicoccus halotolerans TaxID=1748220 RepID=UPI001E657F0F
MPDPEQGDRCGDVPQQRRVLVGGPVVRHLEQVGPGTVRGGTQRPAHLARGGPLDVTGGEQPAAGHPQVEHDAAVVGGGPRGHRPRHRPQHGRLQPPRGGVPPRVPVTGDGLGDG